MCGSIQSFLVGRLSSGGVRVVGGWRLFGFVASGQLVVDGGCLDSDPGADVGRLAGSWLVRWSGGG